MQADLPPLGQAYSNGFLATTNNSGWILQPETAVDPAGSQAGASRAQICQRQAAKRTAGSPEQKRGKLAHQSLCGAIIAPSFEV